MTSPLPQSEEMLRQGFRLFNRFMLLMWRLGLGRWLNGYPKVLGRYVVLVHTGRKSGLTRYTPVNFAELDGDLYVTAGFGAVSDWYRNLMANPAGEVWMADGWWAGRADDVTEMEGALPKLRMVLIGSGFMAPLMGLDLNNVSDSTLAEKTRDYRLLRIERLEARTGRGGPGELAWIWPALVFTTLPLLAGAALRGRKRGRR